MEMMKKVFFNVFSLFIFFSFFLISCVSNEKQVKKAELHHQMALSLMKKCQYPSALAALNKALKLNEDDPMFHHSVALLYFQFKKYGKSVEHLNKALKLNSKFTDARVHLGRSLIEVGKWNQGLKELQKAKEDLTYRYSENIHAHMGLVYYKQKNFSLAEKHLNVARTIKKEGCFTALYHAKSLYFQDQFQKALAILEPSKLWCEKNLPLCSSPSFDSYFFAALAYNKLGQKQKAFLNLQIFLNKAKNSEYLNEAKKQMNLLKGLN